MYSKFYGAKMVGNQFFSTARNLMKSVMPSSQSIWKNSHNSQYSIRRFDLYWWPLWLFSLDLLTVIFIDLVFHLVILQKDVIIGYFIIFLVAWSLKPWKTCFQAIFHELQKNATKVFGNHNTSNDCTDCGSD